MAAAHENNVPEARIGRVLRDKWRLDRVLGTGGFGAVYAATHRNGKRVAIKMLHPGLSAHPEVRDRFLREAYAVNVVDHPGVVSVLDDDVDEDGCVFLVMELLDGETLEDRRIRSGGKLDVLEVLSIADQVLDVLAAAHDKGVIHRDLKPENVFLQRTGQAKLLDFGIAKQRQSPRGAFATIQGTMLGTPAFMPPEQARGKLDLVDERSDIWALAATLWSLLTGDLVHGDLTPGETLAACISKPAPSLATASPGMPRPMVDLIDRALAFEREGRFQSAREMQQAVRMAYQIIRGSHSAPPPPPPPPPAQSADEDPTEIFDRVPIAAPAARPRIASLSDEDPTEVVDRARVTGIRATASKRPGGPELASIFDSADFGASVSTDARTPVREAKKKPAERRMDQTVVRVPTSRAARWTITALVALMMLAALGFAVVAVMHLQGRL
jgi:serine/threonine-protein kinase